MLNEILQTKGPILIRASAGTGKTYTLTKKVIRLIVDEQLEIDQILAVTFTEFASAEMRDRIYTAITEAMSTELDPVKKAHLERQRVRFHRNQISTFHGFCMRLIQSYPDVAGLETEIRVMDPFQQAQFDQQVKTAFYREHKNHAPLIRLLMRYGPREVEETIHHLGDLPETRLEELKAMPAAVWLERLRASQEAMVAHRDECYARLRAFVDANPGVLRAGAALPATFPAGEAFADVFTKEGKLHGKKMISHGADPEVKAKAVEISLETNEWMLEISGLGVWLDRPEADILAELEDPDTDSVLPDTLSYHAMRDLADVAIRWRRFFKAERLRIGTLIFDDLIQITHRMLVGQPGFAAKIAAKYRAMVVDEFQDTDTLQWEILSAIRPDPSADLLLVGDVKQAIYEFRGGNVSVMQRVAQTLPHTEFTLGQSWRSAKTVVAEINRLFRTVFPVATDRLYEAVAQDLEHPGDVKNANTALGSVRYLWLPDRLNAKQAPVRWPSAERADAEARSTAHFLRGIADGTVEGYDDIRELLRKGEKAVGILLPSRKTQWKFEQALRDVGLPFASFSGKEFYQTQVVSDALALIRYLTDAYQNVATAAVYRSPFVGFSDVALVLMRDGAKSDILHNVVRDWLEAPHPDLPDEDRLVLGSAIPWLLELRKMVKQVRLSDILTEAFFHRSYLEADIDRAQTAANAHKLIRIVRDLEQQGTGSLVDVDEFLTRQREDEAEEREGMVDDAGCIQFMTVHGSKGLEFPMVILPALGAKRSGDNGIVARSPRDIDAAEAWVIPKGTSTLSKDDYKGVMYHQVRDENALRQDAEQRRLFYVACTRARTHLAFWGLDHKATAGSFTDYIDDARDVEHSGHTTLPPEWLVPPTPRDLPEPRREIGDRAPLAARLAEADRIVTLPSKVDDEVAYSGDEPVDGRGPWQTLDPREAGNLIHKALEHSGWTQVDWPRIERLVRRLWPQPSVDRTDFDAVMAHVRRAVEALVQRFPRAALRRHEVAFEADVPGTGLVKGIIDLLVQDADGTWHIVDFKTGGVEPHLEAYIRQLSLYREALAVLGIEVTSMSLLETATGEVFANRRVEPD
jgi:ATP-dependent helicase/nuclease subunit A